MTAAVVFVLPSREDSPGFLQSSGGVLLVVGPADPVFLCRWGPGGAKFREEDGFIRSPPPWTPAGAISFKIFVSDK